MQLISKVMEGVLALDEEKRLGLEFDAQPIPGDSDVIQVLVNGQEELPIFVTASDDQILCICYLWSEDEVKSERKQEMLEAMLDMNMPMPLSSFGRIDDKYAIFGAMSTRSTPEDMAVELAMLNDNAIDAIDALLPYLK